MRRRPGSFSSGGMRPEGGVHGRGKSRRGRLYAGPDHGDCGTERNRYQNIYTSQLWQVEADPEGNTFEEVLKDQMGRFLVELATVDQMAQEQGVELTSQEEDSLKSLSQEYYAGLTQEDLDYMGVAQDEVYDLYCMYYRRIRWWRR